MVSKLEYWTRARDGTCRHCSKKPLVKTFKISGEKRTLTYCEQCRDNKRKTEDKDKTKRATKKWFRKNPDYCKKWRKSNKDALRKYFKKENAKRLKLK